MSDEVRVTSDECETVAGIEAELRKTADDMAKTLGDQHSYVEFYRELADRIEKARAPLGNAAKIREALKRLLAWLDKYGDSYSTPDRFTEDEIKAVWAERQVIVQQCRAALAAPARNCDIYRTLEEAKTAYVERNGHVGMWDGVTSERFEKWLLAKEGDK